MVNEGLAWDHPVSKCKPPGGDCCRVGFRTIFFRYKVFKVSLTSKVTAGDVV